MSQAIHFLHRDAASVEGLPTSSVYPTKDDDGNFLTTEYGLCQYRDHQVVTVQVSLLYSAFDSTKYPLVHQGASQE